MILTGLAPDPRRPDYRLVEVDRGRFASLAAEDLELLDLRIGAPISKAAFARLQELADLEAAHRAALRALARRAHARFDLRRRLLQKQHPPAAVDGALDRLAAAGLLDDARFAADYAAAKAYRGRGPARLIRDLLALGIDRRVAEEAVQTSLAAEGLDPARAVRVLAEKRARQLAGLPAPVRKRRLTAFLVRRGFQGSEVRSVVEAIS
ncbi:MAG TPA: RecX family transcriptional regulator [Gemmatimonadales bacterium]|nr:RecX family transcriptional regulator [Gemmatimonadales bacterium]